MPNQLILDRYRIIGQAGEGGFAMVHAAWDTKLQRKVAIKTIKLSELDAYRVNAPASHQDEPLPWEDDPAQGLEDLAYPNDPDFLGGYCAATPADDPSVKLDDVAQERYMSHIPGLDEARAAAFLNDTNIVQTYDFQTVGNQAYIIMEYVEGMTLTSFMEQYDSELTLDIIGSIFADVVHALETAHENQVMHLDIKPDNILINRKGVVKVTDFGLATLSDLDGNAYTHGGTIGYMPLEQMRQEALDERCDEWALASVTYQLLAGENPFMAASLSGAERAIMSAELVLPSLMWEDLDDQADDVLFYALDPNRDERYENVTDFAEEFQPLLGDPAKGRRELARLVSHAPQEEDSLSGRVRAPRTPLRDRISIEALGVAGRVLAALGSAILTFLALTNIPQTSSLGAGIMLGVAAISGGLGAFRPGWGVGFAGIAWAVALCTDGQYMLAGVLALATIAWWLKSGKSGFASGGVALAHPFAAIAHVPVAGPLLAGCTLRPASALATTFYCVVLSFVFGCVGSGNMLGFDAFRAGHFTGHGAASVNLAVQLAQVPGTWVIALSWLLTAPIFSAFAHSARRWVSLTGGVIAFLILLAGLIGAQAANTGFAYFAPDAASVAGCFIACIVAVAIRWAYGEELDADEQEELS